MKMLIAVPCMDQVPAAFAQSLALLRKVCDTACAFQIGSLIYRSRNDLALQAAKMEADYILWLDSDMVFEPDLAERLYKTMETTGADIVTGLYFRRVPPYTPVLFDRIDIKEEICSWSQFKEIPAEPFEVGACGFGGLLMKTDPVLDVQGKFGNLFAPIGNTGEDIAFCWRARQCGYKIICDPSIILGHVGHIIVDESFYMSYAKVNENGTGH